MGMLVDGVVVFANGRILWYLQGIRLSAGIKANISIYDGAVCGQNIIIIVIILYFLITIIMRLAWLHGSIPWGG